MICIYISASSHEFIDMCFIIAIVYFRHKHEQDWTVINGNSYKIEQNIVVKSFVIKCSLQYFMHLHE